VTIAFDSIFFYLSSKSEYFVSEEQVSRRIRASTTGKSSTFRDQQSTLKY